MVPTPLLDLEIPSTGKLRASGEPPPWLNKQLSSSTQPHHGLPVGGLLTNAQSPSLLPALAAAHPKLRIGHLSLALSSGPRRLNGKCELGFFLRLMSGFMP